MWFPNLKKNFTSTELLRRLKDLWSISYWLEHWVDIEPYRIGFRGPRNNVWCGLSRKWYNVCNLKPLIQTKADSSNTKFSTKSKYFSWAITLFSKTQIKSVSSSQTLFQINKNGVKYYENVFWRHEKTNIIRGLESILRKMSWWFI